MHRQMRQHAQGGEGQTPRSSRCARRSVAEGLRQSGDPEERHKPASPTSPVSATMLR